MSRADVMFQHTDPVEGLSAMGYATDNAEAGPSRRPATKVRKRPAQLKLSGAANNIAAPRRSFSDSPGVRSVPASPIRPQDAVSQKPLLSIDLRDTLRGTPRRRPSVLFPLRTRALPALRIAPAIGPSHIDAPSPQPPSIWQDPSEHTLSGNGSSLQHARSSYAAGAIEVLPGLFLGDEFNARDEAWLAANHVTTILNVSKEIDRRLDDDQSMKKSVDSDLSSGVRSLRISEDVTTPTVLSYRNAATHAEEHGHTADTDLRGHTARTASFCLRSHSSTPNLLTSMAKQASHSNDESSSDATTSDESTSFDTEDTSDESLSSSVHESMIADGQPAPLEELKPSPPNSALLTPMGSSFSKHSPDTAATSNSSTSSTGWNVALPSDAVSMDLRPDTDAGRTWPIRYIQLPWTHDQTDLASGTSKGGFLTGCAIIAEALGVDRQTGQTEEQDGEQRTRRGGVLVHCQCGVSRSATLVIAFVMQAAALQHNFPQTESLTGMHDCYGMVKELSSSISPNISLIYQLVEWERFLSGQVSLRESARASAEEQGDTPPGQVPAGERRWGREVMDEEAWMRMRAEEERREHEEEQRQAQNLPPAQLPSRMRSTSESSFAVLNKAQDNAANATDGVAARRKKSAPRLTLTDSAVAGADRALRLGKAAPVDVPGPAPLSLAKSPHKTLQGSGESVGSPSANSKAFGALLSSAAERRLKHKRAFSRDVPDWPLPSVTAAGPQASSMDADLGDGL